MKSIQHVLWRGALALGLMAVGIGTSLGLPPVEQSAAAGDCPIQQSALVADQTRGNRTREQGTTLIVLRRPLSPAG